MKRNGIDSDVHDVDDTKMICNLTNHSKQNRNHCPFLLCKCKRGDAVKTFATYKYQILDDDVYLKHYEKSERAFKKKIGEECSERNVKTHRDWVDLRNYGIDYFGVHPSLLPISRIGLDIFRCRLSIVRNAMSFIRKYSEGFCYSLLEQFRLLLRDHV